MSALAELSHGSLKHTLWFPKTLVQTFEAQKKESRNHDLLVPIDFASRPMGSLTDDGE